MRKSSCIKAFLFVSACILPFQGGYAYYGVNYTVDCDSYKQSLAPDSILSEEDQLRNLPYHTFELGELAAKCSIPGNKLDAALKQFFRYDEVVGQSHGPQGQIYAKGTSESDIQKIQDGYQKQLVAMQEEFKKGDVEHLKFVIRFMVWQTDDDIYAYSACELMARLFPADYDSLKGLTREHSVEREDWENAKKDWLSPPAKH